VIGGGCRSVGANRVYTEIGWQVPLDAAGRKVNVAQQNERRAIEQAERALGSRDWKAALDYIRSIPTPIGSYARKIATEAALRCEDWPFLKALFAGSHSTSETTILISALTNLGDLDGADEVLACAEGLEEPLRRSLAERIALLRLMKGPR
jgi:hypothetical protein